MRGSPSNMSFLPDLMSEHVVRDALLEDLGRAGDITTNCLIGKDTHIKASLAARQPGVIAGSQCARQAFQLLDPNVSYEELVSDGEAVEAGQILARVEGEARSLLSSERVALNFLCRLSGIASATSRLRDACHPYSAQITCTRKTTPGLRFLEKAAVRTGGGNNHRFGLDDAVLIKDNHIAAVGSVASAIQKARASVGHLVMIEVEVDTLQQLDEAISAGPDAVLLDNMSIDELRRAVEMIDGKLVTEASGSITIDTINDVAKTGVDVISVGWLTHSVTQLDIGLDIVDAHSGNKSLLKS